MTPETAAFLLALVNSLNLSVGADNFDEMYANIQKAKSELFALLPSAAPEPAGDDT